MEVPGNGAASPLSSQTRTATFRAALATTTIDLPALKVLAATTGLPDHDPSIRSLVWQLLLGYLPLDRAQWHTTSARKEAEYSQFCRELIVDPRTLGRPPAELEAAAAAALKPSNEPAGFSPLQRTTVTQDDHPLSTANSSRWRAFFADTEIREQIERDVDRTHPDLHFFSGQTETAQIHRASMRRALFIFAKLNPGLRYVQGMNELMAVLYHTFAIGGNVGSGSGSEFKNRNNLGSSSSDHQYKSTSDGTCMEYSNSGNGAALIASPLSDPLGGGGGMISSPPLVLGNENNIIRNNSATTPTIGEKSSNSGGGGALESKEESREDDVAPSSAEVTAFFTFVDLLGEFRDHFCQQLDNSEVGIRATMSRLDSVLWTHLERTNAVNPQFYAFRWITTLLTQEFSFPDVLRLWDAILSDLMGRSDCLLRICLAMVLLVREELLQGDFAANLKLLQQYPPMDVGTVLRMADSLKSYKTVIVQDDF